MNYKLNSMAHTLRMLVLTMVCCWCITNTQAQNWCLPGAQWHYAWYYFSATGYVHYQYTHDTVYAGRSCQVLQAFDYSSQTIGGGNYHLDTSALFNVYTYAQSDTVYFYNNNKWAPTYFFAAQVGDTLTLTNNYFINQTDTALRVVVDTVGLMQVDTHQLRYYTFHLLDSCWGMVFTGKVVERIGMIDNALIPYWHCVTDDYYYYLRCYSDNTFAQYPAGANCNYLLTAIKEPETAIVNFTLFPNPSNGNVTISIAESIMGSNTIVTDVTGRMIAAVQLTSTNTTLNTSGFAKGVYLVKVQLPNETVAVKKFVVE